MPRSRPAMLFLLPGLFALASLSLGAQITAIRAGKAYPAGAPPIEPCVILIEDGRITAVGRDVAVPAGATVLDYRRNVVIPGLVEAHACRGYDLANEANALTPFVSVLDALDPSHDAFELALRDGVTTLNVLPGNETILGGTGAVVKPVGLVVKDMVVLPVSGMKISVSGTSAFSRMGAMAQLRRYLAETRQYLSAPADAGRMVATPGAFRSPQSVKYEAVADLLRGRSRAFIYCETAGDVLRAHGLSEEYGLDAVFVLGPDCVKAAEAVASGKWNVVLDPEIVRFEQDPATGKMSRIDVAGAFHDRGAAFALQSDPRRVDARSLFYQGMRAMSQGLTREEALDAVTLRPARILGMDKTIGSLEPGKAADLVVLDGEPFELRTRDEFVLIGGRVAYDRTKDLKLQALMDDRIDR